MEFFVGGDTELPVRRVSGAEMGVQTPFNPEVYLDLAGFTLTGGLCAVSLVLSCSLIIFKNWAWVILAKKM